MNKENLFITCKKYGGTKFGLACAHYDRYRSCRRYCAALRQLIKDNPEFKENVSIFYSSAIDENVVLLPSKFCCSGLPFKEFQCHLCSFAGKSERGLKSHITRSHNDKKNAYTKQ